MCSVISTIYYSAVILWATLKFQIFLYRWETKTKNVFVVNLFQQKHLEVKNDCHASLSLESKPFEDTADGVFVVYSYHGYEFCSHLRRGEWKRRCLLVLTHTQCSCQSAVKE